MADADRITRLNAALEGRYRIERELGEGGMATVYVAKDLRHHRSVALKVLKTEVGAALGPERFLREIELTASLDHPHIVPLLDSGEADGLLFYVMPFVDGETLRTRLDREGQLPLEETLRIVREIADGLAYAHATGIVHRDVKPSNILLSAGHARVADFGVARALAAAGERALTATGTSLGTPAYMSPEQAEGGTGVDERADVYALGCIAYEMLAGEPPHTGSTSAAIIAKKLAHPVPHVRALRRTVPDVVDEAVTKALATVSADRFSTVVEFVERLDEEASHPQTSWKRPAVVTLLTLLAGITGLTWTLGGGDSAAAPVESLVVLPFENISGDPVHEAMGASLRDALSGRLAQLEGIEQVTSRGSAMRFPPGDRDIVRIADELDVDAVVDGSIMVAGDRIAINVELVDGRQDRVIWNRRYDRDLRDVFTVINEATQEMVSGMQMTLSPEETSRLTERNPVDPRVFRAWTLGNAELHDLTLEGMERALGFYEDAIRVDSAFAPAHAGRAMAYSELASWWGPPGEQERYISLARSAAETALEMDSTVAEAYLALGRVAMLEWDWEEASKTLARSLTLNPEASFARLAYANFLTAMGRFEESIPLARETLQMDPLSPLAYNELSWALWLSGEVAGAQEIVLESFAVDPDFHQTLIALAMISAHIGDREQALRATARAARDPPATITEAWIGFVYGQVGMEERARDILHHLEQLATREPVSPATFVILHLGLAEDDQAIEWLERAYDQRSPHLVWLKVAPYFDPVRSDPRFQRLIVRMGFPE